MTAPDQIFASPDRQDGWRWPRASKFPEQGPYENVSYTRSDLTPDPAAIREAALREAAAECQTVLDNAKSFGLPQMAIGAAQCREVILALIGEKE